MKSRELYKKAVSLMPGGVSSPVRAIKPYPFFTNRAKGSRIYTVEGTPLIDCCMAYGPLFLGHAHPDILDALRAQLVNGWIYGTPSPLELDLASILIADHPSVQMVRFVSSGAEATMAALRLARGYAEKNDIIKIEGGFHGAHDTVLVKAGSGATTHGIPDSAGVNRDLVKHTLQVPFNDAEALEKTLMDHDTVAALIIEPIMGNIGPILPTKGYLRDVRSITAAHDVLLIFDEVITGYRLGIGGAQVQYSIQPDITTFGKIIGGGLPIGALSGRRRIMEFIAPSGPVYQAGTFNGNPLSLSAGIATIRWIHRHPNIYRRLDEATSVIEANTKAKGNGIFVRYGSMFKYFFRTAPPQNYQEAKECNTDTFREFWKKMLKQGIFLPPSQFETNFISTAHSPGDVEFIGATYNACI